MTTSNKTSNINNSPGSQQAMGDGITQIQADNLTIIYGNDAQRITDYLSAIVAKFGPLRERYIDLEGSAPPARDPDDPFANPFLVTPVMRMEKENEPVPSVQAALDAHERLVRCYGALTRCSMRHASWVGALI